MLKPTQDNKAEIEIAQIMWDFKNHAKASESAFKWTHQIMEAMERRGYHVGLPSGIEEALNSGDGTYRP